MTGGLLWLRSPWTEELFAPRTAYSRAYAIGIVTLVVTLLVGRRILFDASQRRSARAWVLLEIACVMLALAVSLDLMAPVTAQWQAVQDGLLTVIHAVLSASHLGFAVVVLRTRLGDHRDRDGLIDALIIAAAIGLLTWDALSLTADGQGAITGSSLIALLLLSAVLTGSAALWVRILLTGAHRLASARWYLVSMVLQTIALVIVTSKNVSLERGGAGWEAELVTMLTLVVTVVAAVHPTALRVPVFEPDGPKGRRDQQGSAPHAADRHRHTDGLVVVAHHLAQSPGRGRGHAGVPQRAGTDGAVDRRDLRRRDLACIPPAAGASRGAVDAGAPCLARRADRTAQS